MWNRNDQPLKMRVGLITVEKSRSWIGEEPKGLDDHLKVHAGT